MLEAEKQKLEGYDLNYDKYWVPINWAFALVIKARQEGLIFAENYAVKITDVSLQQFFRPPIFKFSALFVPKVVINKRFQTAS